MCNGVGGAGGAGGAGAAGDLAVLRQLGAAGNAGNTGAPIAADLGSQNAAGADQLTQLLSEFAKYLQSRGVGAGA